MLTSCSDCGRKISVSAKSCPSCGNTYRSTDLQQLSRDLDRDYLKLLAFMAEDGKSGPYAQWMKEDVDLLKEQLEEIENEVRRSEGQALAEAKAARDRTVLQLAEKEGELAAQMQRAADYRKSYVKFKAKHISGEIFQAILGIIVIVVLFRIYFL